MAKTTIVIKPGGPSVPTLPEIDTKELDQRLKQVRRKHGTAIVMTAAEMLKPKGAIPTGSLTLDKTLRVGGFPRGRMTEVFGPPSAGKTTLAQCAVAQCQKQGGVACYLDLEEATTLDYMEACSIDTDSLLLSMPPDGSQAMAMIFALIDQVDLIVVDSTAALMSEQEARSDAGDQHVGELSRLLSQELKRMVPRLGASRTALVFLNQIRERIGVMYGNPETTPGGNALKFYASIRLRLAKRSRPDKNGHFLAKAVVRKSKVGPPLEEAEFALTPTGIDQYSDIVQIARETGVLTLRGSYYFYDDPDTSIGQGVIGAADWLREHPEKTAEIRDHVLASTQPTARQAQPTTETDADDVF